MVLLLILVLAWQRHTVCVLQPPKVRLYLYAAESAGHLCSTGCQEE